MTMSNDQVKFKLSQNMYEYSSSKRKKMQKILQAAFDMNFRESNDLFSNACGEFYLICRPSQFARFLIYRNDEGLQNAFKELEAVLCTQKIGNIIDVHKRSHQACYDTDFSNGE